MKAETNTNHRNNLKHPAFPPSCPADHDDDQGFPYGWNSPDPPPSPDILPNGRYPDLQSPISRIVSPRVPSTYPIGIDKVIAYLPQPRIPFGLIQTLFKPVDHRSDRWFCKCIDSEGRYLALKYCTGSFGSMMKLSFSPNQVLHGHNAFPAMPDDADEIMQVVDNLIRRRLWFLQLPSVYSERWLLSGVDYNIDRIMPGHVRDCLCRGLAVLPFKQSSRSKIFHEPEPCSDDGDDAIKLIQGLFTCNEADTLNVCHALYSKELEFAEHHPSLVHLVRGVVRDEVRLRGKDKLIEHGFSRLTIAEALSRTDRVSVFKAMLERHGISQSAVTGACADSFPMSEMSKALPYRVLLAASLNALPYAATFKHRGKQISPGSVGNIRRKQKAAGRYHFDADINAALSEYAAEVFLSPPGAYVHAVAQDAQEDDAISGAIWLKLAQMTAMQPAQAQKKRPKPPPMAHVARCRRRPSIGLSSIRLAHVVPLSRPSVRTPSWPFPPRRLVWKPILPQAP